MTDARDPKWRRLQELRDSARKRMKDRVARAALDPSSSKAPGVGLFSMPSDGTVSDPFGTQLSTEMPNPTYVYKTASASDVRKRNIDRLVGNTSLSRAEAEAFIDAGASSEKVTQYINANQLPFAKSTGGQEFVDTRPLFDVPFDEIRSQGMPMGSSSVDEILSELAEDYPGGFAKDSEVARAIYLGGFSKVDPATMDGSLIGRVGDVASRYSKAAMSKAISYGQKISEINKELTLIEIELKDRSITRERRSELLARKGKLYSGGDRKGEVPFVGLRDLNVKFKQARRVAETFDKTARNVMPGFPGDDIDGLLTLASGRDSSLLEQLNDMIGQVKRTAYGGASLSDQFFQTLEYGGSSIPTLAQTRSGRVLGIPSMGPIDDYSRISDRVFAEAQSAPRSAEALQGVGLRLDPIGMFHSANIPGAHHYILDNGLIDAENISNPLSILSLRQQSAIINATGDKQFNLMNEAYLGITGGISQHLRGDFTGRSRMGYALPGLSDDIASQSAYQELMGLMGVGSLDELIPETTGLGPTAIGLGYGHRRPMEELVSNIVAAGALDIKNPNTRAGGTGGITSVLNQIFGLQDDISTDLTQMIFDRFPELRETYGARGSVSSRDVRRSFGGLLRAHGVPSTGSSLDEAVRSRTRELDAVRGAHKDMLGIIKTDEGGNQTLSWERERERRTSRGEFGDIDANLIGQDVAEDVVNRIGAKAEVSTAIRDGVLDMDVDAMDGLDPITRANLRRGQAALSRGKFDESFVERMLGEVVRAPDARPMNLRAMGWAYSEEAGLKGGEGRRYAFRGSKSYDEIKSFIAQSLSENRPWSGVVQNFIEAQVEDPELLHSIEDLFLGSSKVKAKDVYRSLRKSEADAAYRALSYAMNGGQLDAVPVIAEARARNVVAALGKSPKSQDAFIKYMASVYGLNETDVANAVMGNQGSLSDESFNALEGLRRTMMASATGLDGSGGMMPRELFGDTKASTLMGFQEAFENQYTIGIDVGEGSLVKATIAHIDDLSSLDTDSPERAYDRMAVSWKIQGDRESAMSALRAMGMPEEAIDSIRTPEGWIIPQVYEVAKPHAADLYSDAAGGALYHLHETLRAEGVSEDVINGVTRAAENFAANVPVINPQGSHVPTSESQFQILDHNARLTQAASGPINTVAHDRMARNVGFLNNYTAMHERRGFRSSPILAFDGDVLGVADKMMPKALSGGVISSSVRPEDATAASEVMGMINEQLRGISHGSMSLEDVLNVSESFNGRAINLGGGESRVGDLLDTVGPGGKMSIGDRLYSPLAAGNTVSAGAEALDAGVRGRVAGLAESFVKNNPELGLESEQLTEQIMRGVEGQVKGKGTEMGRLFAQAVTSHMNPDLVDGSIPFTSPEDITKTMAEAIHDRMLAMMNPEVLGHLREEAPQVAENLDRIMVGNVFSVMAGGVPVDRPTVNMGREGIETGVRDAKEIASKAKQVLGGNKAMSMRELWQNHPNMRKAAIGATALAAFSIASSVRKKDMSIDDMVGPSENLPGGSPYSQTPVSQGSNAMQYNPTPTIGYKYVVRANGVNDPHKFANQVQGITGGKTNTTISGGNKNSVVDKTAILREILGTYN